MLSVWLTAPGSAGLVDFLSLTFITLHPVLLSAYSTLRCVLLLHSKLASTRRETYKSGAAARIMTTALPHIVIAIDGPSGAGKSTVAKRLAHALGYCYVDSGAMYRVVGWVMCRHAIAVDDSAALMALLAQTPIQLTVHHGQAEIWVAGHNVTCQLRGEVVGKAASAVATVLAVRQMITAKLRRLRCQADLVMEGRDIGSVVFPDATLKFFLDASLEVRGQRRFQEMQQTGHAMTGEQVQHAVAARDVQDRTRAAAPLVCAPEARVIDTTNLTIDEVVQIMLSEVCTQIPQRNA
jgi:CMP/dCMP kinase